MKVIEIRQSTTVKARPEEVYDAVMDPETYEKITGRQARLGRREGDSYVSFDGLIDGLILHLEPGRKIVRSWRAQQLGWPEDHYSQVSLSFDAVEGGTRVTCRHKLVPENLAQAVREGWSEGYFQPLKAWFRRS